MLRMMQKLFRLFISGGVIVLGSLGVCQARDDVVPGSRYTSGRGAAMGDAVLPVIDDVAGGLFYNPANLSKIRRREFELKNFMVYGNAGLISNFGLGTLSLTSLSGFLNTLKEGTPSYLGGGAAWMMDIGFPLFSFGVLLQNELAARYNSDQSVTYRSRYQLIPALGTSFHLLAGILRMGYTLQWVNQASGVVTTSSLSSLSYKKGLAQGSAFSHNLALALTIPVKLVPSFHLVVRNLGSAQFQSSTLVSFAQGISGTPADEPMTLDGALGLQAHLSGGVKMNVVGEYRDMSNQSSLSIGRRLAFGTEFVFYNQFFLRGGLSGLNPSAGVGIRHGKGEIAFTYQTVDLGSSTQIVPDARYLIHYQLRNF